MKSSLRSVTSKPPLWKVIMIYPASSSTLIRCTMLDRWDVDLCSVRMDGPFPFQLRCIWMRFRPKTLSIDIGPHFIETHTQIFPSLHIFQGPLRIQRAKLIEHRCWAWDISVETCCVAVDSVFVQGAEFTPRFAYRL